MKTSINEVGQLWRCPREKVIFLGFEGVLHKRGARTFDKLSLLEGFLRLHPQISLVISSEWRRADRFHLESVFSEDIRNRLSGKTATERLYSLRSTEVQLWADRNHVTDFIALDSDPDRFRPDWGHQLIAKATEGLSLLDVSRLQLWAEQTNQFGGLSA